MQKSLLIALSLLTLSGCKLGVIVTEGGDVESASDIRDCAAGTVCEFEINDTNFTDAFTAVPKDGYQFVKWRGGSDFFCADQVNPTCALSNVGGAGNATIEAVVASFQLFLIMPVFEFVGIDTDEDGIFDHLDPDDDDDGIPDGDDPCPLNPDPLCGPAAVVEQLLSDACWTVNADVGNAVAQSFIAPASGTISEITLAVQSDAADANLVISEGDINGSVVFFQALGGPPINNSTAAMTPFTLNTPLAVSKDQLYTVAVTDSGGFGLRFCGTSTNPYADGNAYQMELFSTTAYPSDDAAFSITIN